MAKTLLFEVKAGIVMLHHVIVSLWAIGGMLVSCAFAKDDFTDITPAKDLADWVVEGTKDYRQGEQTRPIWSVADGVLTCAGKGFGFLRYDQRLCDFALRAEYRMSKGCNGGLGIRTVKFTGSAATRPSYAAYEIQILDDAGKKPNEHSSMSLYRYVAATANPVKPAGEWNTIEVECRGPKIRITLNGQTVQDVDQSKIAEIKDKPLCGYFSLQNHGSRIEWRNLRLKPLDVQTEAASVGTPPATTGNSTSNGIQLRLRSRSENTKGSGAWQERVDEHAFAAHETAILICDLWDKHWCAKASERCDALAKKMAPIINDARAQGVHIIHCPSDTIDYYKDTAARRRMLAAPRIQPPIAIARWCPLDAAREGPLPIDDSDGGCDDSSPVESYKAWSRQHTAVAVDDDDVVSEDGAEVYNYLQQQGIKNILYVGVHTNMCVLGRSFGIRQMTRLGFNTVLVRDLTDAMYNPAMRPHVDHQRGVDLVVEHVEKHWCPTTTSQDLANFASDILPARQIDTGERPVAPKTAN